MQRKFLECCGAVCGLIVLTSNNAMANDSFGCLTQMEMRTTSVYQGRELTLNFCDLRDADMLKVASYLDKNADIVSLQIESNHITSEGIAALANHISTLAKLTAAHNAIDDEGAKVLATNQKFEFINLNNNSIGANGAAALATLPKLSFILLNNNYIGDDGAIELAKNPKIRFMMIANNQISYKGAQAIGAGLPALNELDISNNYIGDKGAQYLAQNQHVWDAFLANNHISDVGAKALTESNLRFIDLDHNDIGDEGAIALAKGTKNPYGLGMLYIAFNHVGASGIAALEKSGMQYYAMGNDGQGAEGMRMKDEGIKPVSMSVKYKLNLK